MAKEEKTAAELYRQERKARLAKAAKKNAKKSISSNASKTIGRLIITVFVVAVVAAVGAIAVNQSGIIPRSRTAFTVGDVKISEAEYNYYYQDMFQKAAQYAYYGYNIGFDSSVAPENQKYSGVFGAIESYSKDEEPTWADYFEYGAKTTIQSYKAAVAAAAESEITLDDSDLAKVQDTIDHHEESAASASKNKDARYSLSAYLKASYGKGMTKKLFKSILCDRQLSEKVKTVKTNEYRDSLSKSEIEKEYNKNLTNYAVVDLRSYKFAAEKVASKDGESETEAVTDKTMAAAKADAEAFAAAVKDEESFKTLASEAAKKAGNKDYKDYLKDDSMTLMDETSYETLSSTYDEDLIKWAYDKDAKVGSTYISEDKESGYTVYLMVEPAHKAETYDVYDSRHILIKFIEDDKKASDDTDKKTTDGEAADGETTEAETTAKAKEEVKVETLDVSKYKDVTIDLGVNGETAKNKAAYAKAQEILTKYLDGDRTPEAFGKLAHEYSEDTGSNENGGLYEKTPLGQFVPPYEEWCNKEGRKEGDVGIVEYEGSNYSGYHVIYFVSTGVVTWDDAVKDQLASAKFSDYFNELMKSDSVKIDNLSKKLFPNASVEETTTEAPAETTGK